MVIGRHHNTLILKPQQMQANSANIINNEKYIVIAEYINKYREQEEGSWPGYFVGFRCDL